MNRITKQFKIDNFDQVRREADLLGRALNRILNGETSKPIKIRTRNDGTYTFRFWEDGSGFRYFAATFHYAPTHQKDSTDVYCLDEIERYVQDGAHNEWYEIVFAARAEWQAQRYAQTA